MNTVYANFWKISEAKLLKFGFFGWSFIVMMRYALHNLCLSRLHISCTMEMHMNGMFVLSCRKMRAGFHDVENSPCICKYGLFRRNEVSVKDSPLTLELDDVLLKSICERKENIIFGESSLVESVRNTQTYFEKSKKV